MGSSQDDTKTGTMVVVRDSEQEREILGVTAPTPDAVISFVASFLAAVESEVLPTRFVWSLGGLG